MVFGLCTTLLLFLSIFMLILYFENLPQHGLACKGLAIAMHFLLLSSFVWTSVDATFLYKQIVIVFAETKQNVRYTLHSLVFVLPLLVVSVSAGVTLADAYGGENICWIRSDPVFYGALVAPMSLCLGYNLVILATVVITLQRRGKNLATASTNARKGKKALLRVVVSISILLGLTWVFGFLVLADDNIVFQYVFAILNCLQGLFIFVHVIRGQDAKKGVEEVLSSRKTKTGSTTKSTGLLSFILRGRNTRASSTTDRRSISSGTNAKKGTGGVKGVRGIKGGSRSSNGKVSKIPDSAELDTLEMVTFKTPVRTKSTAERGGHATSHTTPTRRPSSLATTQDRHGNLLPNFSQSPTTDDEGSFFVHSQSPVDLPDISNLLPPGTPTSEWRESFELSPLNSITTSPSTAEQSVLKSQRTQSFRNFKFEQYKGLSGDVYTTVVDLAPKVSSEDEE
ncbi:adhesion G protein-coupled receptor E5-like [Sycon ciliatum]|uniref:adhesion G protein-coupled receptor E5-like n=1 Tax=Sycon ciliatum TaxID=27933 RepID=UPI0031F6811D